ncbi:MAG: OmpA family protein [Hydrogenimonas sp.]|nr:MAG: OmpA family protein [Hydrogenimonas sp.]
MKLSTKAISFSLSALLLFSGCAAKNGEAPNNAEKTKQGVLIGTLAGAALGAITSKHHKGKNAAIGAAVGALAGGVIGYSLDKQADEIASSMNTSVSSNEQEAAKFQDIIVTKNENYVKITFKSAMMFETNQADPTPEAKEKIRRLVDVLKHYPETIVQVVGHTDSRGSYDYNLKLSQERALRVAKMLKDLGVTNTLYSRGCSFVKPLVPNDSPANMAINRRVEIYLYPSVEKVIDVCR